MLLKYAFGVDLSTIGGPFLDWLSGEFKKRTDAKAAERFAKTIADRVVDGLVPVFERDHSPDLNPEAVALALGDTLDQHVDGKFLVTHDLDPERLTEATFELRPISDLESKAYGDSNIRLYERALSALIEALVPQAKQFGDFEVANAAEVLARLRMIVEGIAPLVKTHQVWERRRAEVWRDFERAYADAILDGWNKLELFGIDVSAEVQRRQKLSVAFIQLNLESATAENAREAPGSLASFEELLGQAARTARPLVILGEAGGGKTTLLRWAACQAVTRQLETGLSGAFMSVQRDLFEPAVAGVRKPQNESELAWWARAPLLLRLREVQDGVLPKEDAWPAKSAGLPRDPPPDWVGDILGGGHGLILLDGLDELGSTGRDLARDTLRSILRDRRGNLVVVTSRPRVRSSPTGSWTYHSSRPRSVLWHRPNATLASQTGTKRSRKRGPWAPLRPAISAPIWPERSASRPTSRSRRPIPLSAPLPVRCTMVATATCRAV